MPEECVKWANGPKRPFVGDNAPYEYFVGVGGNAGGPRIGPNQRKSSDIVHTEYKHGIA